MPPSYVYMPIVKGKANDIKALSRLSADARTLIKPLVELTPVPDDCSIDEHVISFVQKIVKHVPQGKLFADFYGLLPGATISTGLSATIAGFRLLRKFDRPVTPTFGLDRDNAVWPLLKKEVAQFAKGFCFRIDFDDLDDQTEQTWQEIIERSAQLELEPAKTDLLIDLRHLGNKSTKELKDLVIEFLSYKPQGTAYRSIILAGSSALKHVGEIPKDGIGDVLRRELRLWIELLSDAGEATHLTFGDYGVIHPDFSDQGPNQNANAKIRYTIAGKIIIFRGHKLFNPSDFPQYHVLAERVRSSAGFRGRNFSFGDQYIDDCADFNSGPGNLGNWVLADMNHHVQYSALQLADLSQKVAPDLSAQQIGQLMNII